MLETLKQIIVDHQEDEFRTGIPRLTDITPVPGKATICIGPRRSGKSTYLFQRIRKLIDSGVSRDCILYLNFFDDRLRHLQRDGLAMVLDAYFSLYPEKKNAETLYCFFDEIQVVPGWENFVDRLMRTEKCEVFITGSSAQMLSREIATQMRGRALSWELLPFSFREYLHFKGLTGTDPLSTKRRLLVENAFNGYFEAGGFPEVADLSQALRIKIHQEYWGAMLFRDLVERHDVAHPRAVTDLGHWLVDNVASLYSVNRLTRYLKVHRPPGSEVSGLGLPDLVRRRLFPIHSARFRRVSEPRQRQPQENLLRGSRPSQIRIFGHPGQLRSPPREPCLRRPPPRDAPHSLLQVQRPARGGLRRRTRRVAQAHPGV